MLLPRIKTVVRTRPFACNQAKQDLTPAREAEAKRFFEEYIQ